MSVYRRCTYLSIVAILILVFVTVQASYQESLAQLEMPLEEPLERTGSVNGSGLNYLVFEDPGFGYSLKYPRDWQPIEPTILYGLSGFISPDNNAIVEIRFPPRDGDESLDEFKDNFIAEYMQITTLYNNDTTELGGLPGLIVIGLASYSPNVFEQAAGEEAYSRRVYQAWGLSEERDGFYGVLFNANSKSAYDGYLPVAKRMIDSFTVFDTGLQQDIEDVQEQPDEEQGDAFMGSTGNDEDADDEKGDDTLVDSAGNDEGESDEDENE